MPDFTEAQKNIIAKYGAEACIASYRRAQTMAGRNLWATGSDKVVRHSAVTIVGMKLTEAASSPKEAR